MTNTHPLAPTYTAMLATREAVRVALDAFNAEAAAYQAEHAGFDFIAALLSGNLDAIPARSAAYAAADEELTRAEAAREAAALAYGTAKRRYDLR